MIRQHEVLCVTIAGRDRSTGVTSINTAAGIGKFRCEEVLIDDLPLAMLFHITLATPI